jgi:hypothetical protein
MVASVTLAAVTAAAGGSPLPSQTSWSLDPGLPRSTGFAPTWSPALGAHAHGVHAGPRPVHPALLPEPVQDLEVELVEHGANRVDTVLICNHAYSLDEDEVLAVVLLVRHRPCSCTEVHR